MTSITARRPPVTAQPTEPFPYDSVDQENSSLVAIVGIDDPKNPKMPALLWAKDHDSDGENHTFNQNFIFYFTEKNPIVYTADTIHSVHKNGTNWMYASGKSGYVHNPDSIKERGINVLLPHTIDQIHFKELTIPWIPGTYKKGDLTINPEEYNKQLFNAGMDLINVIQSYKAKSVAQSSEYIKTIETFFLEPIIKEMGAGCSQYIPKHVPSELRDNLKIQL